MERKKSQLCSPYKLARVLLALIFVFNSVFIASPVEAAGPGDDYQDQLIIFPGNPDGTYDIFQNTESTLQSFQLTFKNNLYGNSFPDKKLFAKGISGKLSDNSDIDYFKLGKPSHNGVNQEGFLLVKTTFGEKIRLTAYEKIVISGNTLLRNINDVATSTTAIFPYETINPNALTGSDDVSSMLMIPIDANTGELVFQVVHEDPQGSLSNGGDYEIILNFFTGDIGNQLNPTPQTVETQFESNFYAGGFGAPLQISANSFQIGYFKDQNDVRVYKLNFNGLIPNSVNDPSNIIDFNFEQEASEPIACGLYNENDPRGLVELLSDNNYSSSNSSIRLELVHGDSYILACKPFQNIVGDVINVFNGNVIPIVKIVAGFVGGFALTFSLSKLFDIFQHATSDFCRTRSALPRSFSLLITTVG